MSRETHWGAAFWYWNKNGGQRKQAV